MNKSASMVTQMGWDGHRMFSVISGRDAQGQIICRERVSHKNRSEMRKQLGRWPAGKPVVLEGTFGWGWMADELQAAGLIPRLANSRKVAAWRKARGQAKSNRMDSDLLSELPSQQPPWWEVWLAPPSVRQQREWMRYRMSLVGMQTALKNRVHAVLHRHGVVHEYTDLFGAAGRRFLNLLVAEDPVVRQALDKRRGFTAINADALVVCPGQVRGDVSLPDSGRATLKGNLQLLDQVRRQIAQVTTELRDQVQRCPAGERLRTIPGIGWILAYTLLAEIGDIDRFKNARHLASYSLLAPMACDSGEENTGQDPKGRHVGFVGRRTLKWAWIEAAHSAVRHGGRFREIYDRRTNQGRRDRNRGLIAVAHELCRIAYVIWKKEITYRDTPPARPGSPRRPQSSRPGTGQPDLAMAVAE